MDEYARFAHLYDSLIGPFLRPVHEAMLSTLTAGQCNKVIDLCCGTGLMAGMAADAGLKAVGVDLSHAMLTAGRAKHPTVTFIDSDASSLFFSDNEFDAATISFALHEKPVDIAYAILEEAIRVTRPEGLILVADYRKPISQNSPITRWAIALVERLAGREHAMHYHQYMDAGGSDAFLPRAGLSGVPAMTFLNGWAGLFISVK